MANYEIILGTTGNDVQATRAQFNRRSMKQFLRIGNKRVKAYLIVCDAAIAETIAVKNGRKGE